MREKKVLNENPLRSNAKLNIEIVSENDKVQGLTRYRKCCILCSRESVGVVVLALAVGGANLYLFMVFTRWKTRLGSFIFLILGILPISVVIWFAFRCCRTSCSNTPQTASEVNEQGSFINQFRKWYIPRFGINGKYYLTKMYTFELLEHIQQLYSLRNIYLCLMPVEASTLVCAVLAVELLTSTWLTFRMHSQEIRDMLLLLDTFTDMFCLMFPLLYTHISFNLALGMTQVLLIVSYPTLSLFLKFKGLLSDYFKMDFERLQNAEKDQNRSRRRASILNLPHNNKVFTTQLKYFPKWLRYAFASINIGFTFLFVVTISVHATTRLSINE